MTRRYTKPSDPDSRAFYAEYQALCQRHGLHISVGSNDCLFIGLGGKPPTGDDGATGIEDDFSDGVAFFDHGAVFFHSSDKK